ncbi:MAG: dihydrofolate reductase [Bacteroidaceae bacterium]|nr:dihydrofolate reductase [Bacteroidaceae bacterium]
MPLTLIAALDRNRAIGYKNRLLFRLPDDMRRFKELTTGHTVLMGRHTFESLPKGALPRRRNIVLSRTQRAFAGCETFSSLRDALAACRADEEVFAIGGAAVYAEALPLADRLALTLVEAEAAEADTWFPDWDDGTWHLTDAEHHPADERHAHPFTFANYTHL